MNGKHLLFGSIDVFGALAGIAAVVVLGGVWYSAVLSERWGANADRSKEQTGLGFWLPALFSVALIAAAIAETLIAGTDGVLLGTLAGAAIGVIFVGTGMVISRFASRRSLNGLFAADAGYNVIAFAMMGLILSTV